MLKIVKQWSALSILIICILIFFYFDFQQYLSFANFKMHRHMLMAWTEKNYYLAAFLFMLIYIIVVALSIPGAAFLSIISGFLFGLYAGTLFVVLGATCGALIVFLAIRLAFAQWILKKNPKWLANINKGFKKNEIRYLLILRLIPLFPFWIVNIAAALLKIRLSIFFLTTLIGIIPASFVYVLLGSGLGESIDKNVTPNFNILLDPKIFIPLLLLALMTLLSGIFKVWK